MSPEHAAILMLLTLPVLAALLQLVVPGREAIERVALVCAAATLVLGLAIAVLVARDGSQEAFRGIIHLDALSALMIATISVLGFCGVTASVPYIRHDLEIGHVPGGMRGVRFYYAGLSVFIWSMLVTVSVDNLGLLWVGLEATTIVSALLVGFYRTRAALEAAWKYLMLCTVGIVCALFGVLLTYYAARQGSGGHDSISMDWTRMIADAETLDSGIMRLAFVFVLVGFGAKAGFAPLHTWLADAHSQAPSPISGMLSGVLLACALYAIVRYQALTDRAAGNEFASHFLIGFGVLSILVSVPFILLQRDLKRLFAYSSVEHVGLMAVAFGIGGPLGVTAGLLHLMGHAAAKGMVFFVSGDLVQRYGSRRMSVIRGAVSVAPLSGWLLVAGVLALTGAPPAAIFISEMTMFSAGFQQGWTEMAAVSIVIAALAIIFAGLLMQAMRVGFGPEPPALVAHGNHRASPYLVLAVAPLVAIILLFGIYVPGEVRTLIDAAQISLTAGGG
ncbi:MAG: hydrogenase 4 subunit F [Thermomicrobiales bacterium]|nr:hydrogenase 4 subunit F [Thermomicrobiales bacterium]